MDRRVVLASVAGVAFAGCAAPRNGSPGPTTGEPSVSSSALRAGEVSCGSWSEGASVSWASASVRVTGVLAVSSPCYAPALEDVSYEPEADVLTVVVAARSVKDVCVQCLAEAAYTATVGFEGGLPGRVVVRHESMGGTRTVASVSRQED